jgi:hypothetical protein
MKREAKVGDKVMWDDDEEGFSGIYEITAIRGKNNDDIWLYSSELGTEVQVSLCEIENRIIEDLKEEADANNRHFRENHR